jgi:protein required for attachment to host cells
MAAIRIPYDALVLVGDGAKAIFYRNKGDAQHPNLIVEDVLGEDNPPAREQGTDQPGRGFAAAASARRSAMEETDWHQLAEDRFARDIAEALYRKAHAGRYDKLVVVAPPKVLGELRKSFHKEVAERLIAEVDKTLTGHDVGEIERLLAAAN